MAGLDEVLAAAPPRAFLHIKLDQDSRYFTWRNLWHVENYVMGDTLGQTPDTLGINATSPVHSRKGADIHSITGLSPDRPWNEEICSSSDVVVVRRWLPSPQQVAGTQARGGLP